MTLAQRDAAELALIMSIEQSILAGLTLESVKTATDLHAFVKRDVGERAESDLIRAGLLRLLGDGRIKLEGTRMAVVAQMAATEAPLKAGPRSRLSPLAARSTSPLAARVALA